MAPAFATLGTVLKASTVDLIDGQAESTAAFRQTTTDAQRVNDPPKPAFRVEIGQLTLPAADYAGTTNEERAERLYGLYRLITKRAMPYYDSRVRFSDQALAIEFDDYISVLASGLSRDIAKLARLPQFGEPPKHPGAPPAGTRKFPTAKNGAELRAVEHAFALPGYRIHRQAERREFATVLSYDTIDRAYRKYDATLTPEGDSRLRSTLFNANLHRSYFDAFKELFEYGGLVIGEHHDSPDAFAFVTKHLAGMKKAGLTRLVCETFTQEYQDEIDRFVFGTEDGMGMGMVLHNYVLSLDEGRESSFTPQHNAVQKFLYAARSNRVQVLAADHPAALYSLGVGRITRENAAYVYDVEKRLSRYNWVAANRKPQSSTNTTRCIDVHIAGADHANTSDFGHPGIAQLTGYPAIRVRKALHDGFLVVNPLREDHRKRLTDIPTHPSISATSPSSSRSLTTSPVMRHQQQKQEHTATGGIPID